MRADNIYHTVQETSSVIIWRHRFQRFREYFSRENCNYWLKEIKENGRGWRCLKRRRLEEKGGKGEGSQCEWANMIYGKDDERDYEKKPISSTVKRWRGTCYMRLHFCRYRRDSKGFSSRHSRFGNPLSTTRFSISKDILQEITACPRFPRTWLRIQLRAKKQYGDGSIGLRTGLGPRFYDSSICY